MASRRGDGPGKRYLRGRPPLRRFPGWPLVAAGALGVALLTASALLGDNGLASWQRLKHERAEAEAEVERLRAYRRSLEARIEGLRSDPAALERLAREKYSMHRPGESIIEIIGDENLADRHPAPPPPQNPSSPICRKERRPASTSPCSNFSTRV